MNTFGSSDKHFSAGSKYVQNVHSNFTHTHTATYSYQQLSNRTCLEMIARGAIHVYHALILTSEYAMPTRYIHVYAVAFSARLNDLQAD